MPGGLPYKTASAVLWFAVFGAAAMAWEYTGRDHADEEDVGGVSDRARAVSPVGPLRFSAHTRFPSDGDEIDSENEPAAEGLRQPIDDPEHAALCRFYVALDHMEETRERPVRVMHYGDSILTSDELSGAVRRVLQQRFGDGGHGFVLLGQPWRWYRHMDVDHGAVGKWFARPLSSSEPMADGMFGLGGVAFETFQPGAIAWVSTVRDSTWGNRVGLFDVSYLKQPDGGSFDVLLNGDLIDTVKTRASRLETGHYELKIPPQHAKLVVRTRGNGLVRLFGAVMESGTAGVVYDTLGINGARVSFFDRFEKEHWTSELRHRKAELMILMLGANEGHNEFLELDEYQEHLTTLISTIRQGLPDVACLVVGPMDQARRKKNGQLGSRRMPSKLSDVQRTVSSELNCGFFNTYKAMGGKHSMARWYTNGMGGGDLVHPTGKGARKIGTWIGNSLLNGYEEFRTGDKQCESNVITL